jgi:hypothetical protein
MTPHTLYTPLYLGVLAVFALVGLGIGAWRFPRVAVRRSIFGEGRLFGRRADRV